MLRNKPFSINTTIIPFPDSWSVNPKRVANNFTTEAGTRQAVVVRDSMPTFSGSWTVSSKWLKNFMDWRDEDSLTLSVYDVQTSAFKSYTVSITDDSFQYELIHGSENVRNSEGLYRVSFDMEVF